MGSKDTESTPHLGGQKDNRANAPKAHLADTEETYGSSDVKKWLFRYVLLTAVLAFMNRGMPTPFLPLILAQEFNDSPAMVGFVMSVYPMSAFLATPWASRMSRGTRRIARLHSIAIIVMALATFFFGTCEMIKDQLGTTVAFFFVVFFRALQGVSNAFYLSSNTSLITRTFQGEIGYVVGMVEVAIGIGGQAGRIMGGFLYDSAGFSCPFWSLAVLQVLVGFMGLGFDDQSESSHSVPSASSPRGKKTLHSFKWSQLVTPRCWICLASVFFAYMFAGFYDTTLPRHIEDSLGPISVSMLSVTISCRSLTYMFTAFFMAQAINKDIISFERLLVVGSVTCLMGLILQAPQQIVEEWEMALYPHVPDWVRWTIQMSAIVLSSIGTAGLFIPSLPLMQCEAKHLGDQAVEQISSIFLSTMTVAEGLGPIVGGWLTGKVGFKGSTFLSIWACVPLVFATIMAYDADVIRARSVLKEPEPEALPQALSSPLISKGSPNKAKVFGGRVQVPLDGEAAFLHRRILFEKNAVQIPGSAPSISWRRPFVAGSLSPFNKKRKPWSTAPSTSWRKPFQPRKLPDLNRANASPTSTPVATPPPPSTLPPIRDTSGWSSNTSSPKECN